MRIIFAGTPDFAAETLRALLATEHHICAVYTQPDRPAGRGRKLTASPVKTLAVEHNIPVEQPVNFKEVESISTLSNYNADVMIVVAYGLLLPQSVLDAPKHGCINVHASLLPRWRGAAPIQRAILAGDKETGIGIMQMDAGLDTGSVLQEARCPIHDSDNAQTLHDRLAVLGSQTLVKTLQHLEYHQQHAVSQDNSLTCYAEKLNKQEANLDWQQPAKIILRQINGFNPWPVAQTLWNGQTLRIWQAEVIAQPTAATPGHVEQVTKAGIDIATGEGLLRITELQMPGKRAMSVQNFLNAHQITAGERLG